MTAKRDLKRRVRERQAHTGESYMTALRHVRNRRTGERESEREGEGAVPVVEMIDVSEIAGGDPCQPCGDPRSGLPVGEPRQPLDEWPLAGSSLIVMNLVDRHCNL